MPASGAVCTSATPWTTATSSATRWPTSSSARSADPEHLERGLERDVVPGLAAAQEVVAERAHVAELCGPGDLSGATYVGLGRPCRGDPVVAAVGGVPAVASQRLDAVAQREPRRERDDAADALVVRDVGGRPGAHRVS